MVRWLVAHWSWSRDLAHSGAELVVGRYLRPCQELEHHYVCVCGAWIEQLDSCPAGRFILLEANEEMPLNGQSPSTLEWGSYQKGTPCLIHCEDVAR